MIGMISHSWMSLSTTFTAPDQITELVLHQNWRAVPPLVPPLDRDETSEIGYPDPVPLTDPAVLEDIARKALAVPTPSSLPVTDGAG